MKPEPKQNSLQVISFADVEAKDVSWLWEPYLPLGKLTFLEGDPAVGKTYIALAIAAHVTSGRPIEISRFASPGPDGDPAGFSCLANIEGQELKVHERQNVLYFSAEDDIADTLKPRFTKQGGVAQKLFGTRLAVPKEGEQPLAPFNLSDLVELRKYLDQVRPILVVIDPLQSFIGAGVDTDKANKVQPVLDGVSGLAQEFNCSIVIIRHFTKADYGGKAIYRGQGSMAFAGKARSILVAAKHPTEPDCSALAHSKSSCAMRGPTLQYQIDGDGLHWVGSDRMTADELLTPVRNKLLFPKDQAEDFLRSALANGPRPANQLHEEAKGKGFSLRTLERARKNLGLIAGPAGYQQPWQWSLPEGSPATEGNPKAA